MHLGSPPGPKWRLGINPNDAQAIVPERPRAKPASLGVGYGALHGVFTECVLGVTLMV